MFLQVVIRLTLTIEKWQIINGVSNESDTDIRIIQELLGHSNSRFRDFVLHFCKQPN